jgi:hypothetical protein
MRMDLFAMHKEAEEDGRLTTALRGEEEQWKVCLES